jgi:hypothetical protein
MRLEDDHHLDLLHRSRWMSGPGTPATEPRRTLRPFIEEVRKLSGKMATVVGDIVAFAPVRLAHRADFINPLSGGRVVPVRWPRSGHGCIVMQSLIGCERQRSNEARYCAT